MALAWTLKELERIQIGDVTISAKKGKGRRVTIWIEAPPDTPIIREEKPVKK